MATCSIITATVKLERAFAAKSLKIRWKNSLTNSKITGFVFSDYLSDDWLEDSRHRELSKKYSHSGADIEYPLWFKEELKLTIFGISFFFYPRDLCQESVK
jgi:hypothetical protein